MIRETITVGRPLGIRLDVSLSWVLVFGAMTWTLGGHYFPSRYPTWGWSFTWLAAAAASFVFFACVVVHELAHALMARRFGLPVRSISLFLFGGVAQLEREAPHPRAELMISLVGPLASIGLGALFFVGFLAVPSAPEPISGLCLWLAGVNVGLGVFNLLPSYPLDGGRALRALAWLASGDPRWSNRVALLSGQLGAVGLIFAGVYMLFTQRGGASNAVWVMLVGWFLHSSAVATYQTSMLTAALSAVRVADLMVRRLGRIDRRAAGSELQAELFDRWGPEFFVVTEADRTVGVLSTSDLPTSPADSEADGPDVALIVRDITAGVKPETSLRPEDSAVDALRLFVDRELQWAPVLDQRDVIGVIRRIDLAQYVQRQGSA